MNIYKFLSVVYYIGMALIFLGVLMHLGAVPNTVYVFSAGALFIIGIRAYNQIAGKPENRRIHTILLYSSLFLAPAAWAMYTGRTYWIVFIILTAALDSYASFRRIKK